MMTHRRKTDQIMINHFCQQFNFGAGDRDIIIGAITANWYIEFFFTRFVESVQVQILTLGGEVIDEIGERQVSCNDRLMLDNSGNYFTGDMIFRVITPSTEQVSIIFRIISVDFGNRGTISVTQNNQTIMPTGISREGVLLFANAQIVSLPMRPMFNISGYVEVLNGQQATIFVWEAGEWIPYSVNEEFSIFVSGRIFYVMVNSTQIGLGARLTISWD
jgi:hypothetical protein